MSIPPFANAPTQKNTSSQILRLSALPNQAQTTENIHSNAYVVATNVNATSLSATYVYGQPYDISNWDGVILELTGNSITGSVTALQAQIQMLSYTGAYGNAVITSFTNPTTAIATVPTGSGVLAYYPLSKPFHGIVRIGFAATAAGTGGTFSAVWHLWR